MEPAIFIAIFVVAFPVLWVSGLYITADYGPWRTLAKLYPHDETATGTSYWFASLSMGLFSYKNCLTATANSEQLTLRVILPFRPFHPPVTIPRSAVSHVIQGRYGFLSSVRFQVADYDLRLLGGIATSTFWHSGSSLPRS